jgi:hypothetical protein
MMSDFGGKISSLRGKIEGGLTEDKKKKATTINGL